MTSWGQMTPDLFDKQAPKVQQLLFPAPDPCGTADLADLLTGQEDE